MQFATALAALLLCALAASARADIVYDGGLSVVSKPYKILVAHDDGSGAQTIVTTSSDSGAAQASGLDQLIAPAVSPNGRTIVFEGEWDQANHEQARWSPFAPGYCGIWCSGAYKYEGGTLTRVSHDPSPCPEHPCAVFDSQPEITSAGTIVASYEAVSTEEQCIYSCAWTITNSYVGLDRPPRSGSDFFSAQPGDIPSACDGGDLNNRPQYPSPSPDGTRIVYTNCTVGGTANTTVVQNMDGSGASSCGSDDQPVTDPSFSLDGSRIVEAEGGGDAGLWDFPSACPPASGARVHALVAPSGMAFQSPRYVQGGKIIFVAITSGQRGGEVWSIPATCGQSGSPCQFPADATQVTHTNNDILNVAWTSQSLVSSKPSDSGASTNPGGSGTGTDPGGSGTGTDPGATSGKAARCTVPNLRGKTLKAAAKALRHAHCRLGKVRTRHASRRARGKVVSQSPRPHAHEPAGTRVAVVVGR